MTSGQFKKLFEPARIGQMQMRNRIVMPPMGTGYAAEDGSVSQRLIDYHEARAIGGVGLIIVEVTAVDLQCKGPHQPTLGDDRHLDSWRHLTETAHSHGAKIAAQLWHSTIEYKEGKSLQVGPSSVKVPYRVMGVFGEPPHELTTDEIAERVQWFAAAARRAKDAGFDGVEIHGAHQYLVAAFLSSATNQRQDKYGGSVQNKARFLIDIIQAVRKTVGPDYPVWVRINAQEYGMENGVTIEETKQVVPMAVEAGAQAIHVSGYGAGAYATTAPIADTPGFLVPLAEQVKSITDVPIIAVGRLDCNLGEQILQEGKADLISLGRRLMADPELPNKVAEGKLDEVKPCINCMECIERLASSEGTGVMCTINPATGRERQYRIQPADKAKRVSVVGGGPAGMEAARIAAIRGHKVTLFEKGAKLGGLLNVAALPPHKDDILPWVNYLIRQLERAGVEVMLNTEATPALIAKGKPDAVVVATGGTPAMPDISGVDRPIVSTAQDVLSGKVRVGESVVIIGGGMVGCETGLYLAEQGKNVTIIEILKRMANDMFPMVRRRLMDGLRGKKVALLTSATCEEITNSGVTVTTSEGKREKLPADTIITAVGYQANNDLYRALQGKVPEIYCVGDSFQPRRITEAIDEGYRIGLSL